MSFTKSDEDQLLCSSANTYVVQELLGKGAFGKVVKGYHAATGTPVAIKIVPNEEVTDEVLVLEILRRNAASDHNIVRYYESFQHENTTCLIFEVLQTSLDWVLYKQSANNHCPLDSIRPIARQLLEALAYLKKLEIVHTDIKLDNVMLIDPVRFPNKIKLIDFGLAISSKAKTYRKRTAAPCYRAPEIFIGYHRDESIDIWALGCILAELFFGFRVFRGACECDFDFVYAITHTLGFLPNHILNNSPQANEFFVRDRTEGQGPFWRLKFPHELPEEIAEHCQLLRTVDLSSLKKLEELREIPDSFSPTQRKAEEEHRRAFLHFIRSLLALDATQRLTPCSALQHPFMNPTLYHG